MNRDVHAQLGAMIQAFDGLIYTERQAFLEIIETNGLEWMIKTSEAGRAGNGAGVFKAGNEPWREVATLTTSVSATRRRPSQSAANSSTRSGKLKGR